MKMETFKRFILNEENKISFTKLGASITAIAASILTLVQLDVFYPPKSVTAILVLIAFVGGKITIDGARDAMKKK
jgi:hypothetical protein